MFELISQSRYELQQQILLNTNGLAINTSNRFGNVDALGNISQLNNVSHTNFGESVANGALSAQPNLIVDHFGSGKNAIKFNGTSEYLIKTFTSFAPDWDQEFYIGGTFKTTGSGPRVMTAIAEGAIALRGFRLQFDFDQKLLMAMVNQSAKNRLIRTNNSWADNQIHSYIFHWKGTDNVNDSNFYVDGNLELSTKTSTGSFVGTSLYGGTLGVNLYFGARQDINTNAMFNQYLGKHIYGLGTPNITAITNALNSAS